MGGVEVGEAVLQQQQYHTASYSCGLEQHSHWLIRLCFLHAAVAAAAPFAAAPFSAGASPLEEESRNAAGVAVAGNAAAAVDVAADAAGVAAAVKEVYCDACLTNPSPDLYRLLDVPLLSLYCREIAAAAAASATPYCFPRAAADTLLLLLLLHLEAALCCCPRRILHPPVPPAAPAADSASSS